MNQLLYEKYQRYHAKHAALWALDSPTERIYRRLLDDRLNVPRYMERSDTRRVYRRPDGMAGIDGDPRHVGLRLVGCVVPDGGRGSYWRGSGPFMRNEDIGKLGWCTDPDGHVCKDGEGLVWGVVFQLPSTRRVNRFVAGYNIGGDDYIVVDLSRIYGDIICERDPQDDDHARAAAKVADHMAEALAEEEREYIQRHREENDGWD